jgi:glycosyltransferase involved in cell wall biosynthesis
LALLQAITVRGPFHGVTGHDHHVREFVREMHRQGVAIELQDFAGWHPAKLPDAMRDPWFDSLNRSVGSRVALHFCMPHQVIRDRTKANVNYTMFEADRAPVSWIDRRPSDLVIVPTDSSRRAWLASGQSEQQVRVCPLGIDASLYSAVHKPMELALPAGPDIGKFRTRFLNVSEWIPRKNVEGLLRAWMKATTRNDDAVLIIKLSRHGPLRDMFRFSLTSLEQEVGSPTSAAAPIHFLEATLSDYDMPRLYAAATHYISLSFGEGWDQPMFEAAASGLNLLAPDHTAYRDYLDDSVAHFIPARKIRVKYWGDSATARLFEGAEWWAPDENAAAECIRAEIDGCGMRKESAQKRVLTNFTWATATRRLIAILSEAQEARMRRWFFLKPP